jgi:site-specific DNA-methyltransferase (adenine-specific)
MATAAKISGGGVRFGGRFDRYKESDPDWRNLGDKVRKKIIAWDVAPGKAYFDELFRVSRNQIIWGGNYFSLPPARCFIVWRKLTISENFSMAMAEYAWTSLDGNAKVFECAPQGKANEKRIHACQKPVALYTWLLQRYAKSGDKILDTHVGSASSLIACHRAGLEYWGFEIDKTYFDAAKARLDRETAQLSMFDGATCP